MIKTSALTTLVTTALALSAATTQAADDVHLDELANRLKWQTARANRAVHRHFRHVPQYRLLVLLVSNRILLSLFGRYQHQR